MRYAIVSDLHANLRAWHAVLGDLYEQGADLVVCLGDVVGYGPNPAEVLQSVRSVTDNIVLGNHDAAAVGMMDYSIFNEHARQAIEWTTTILNDEEKQFLSSVPLAIEAGDVLFVHAEVVEPGRFAYISDPAIARQNLESNSHHVTFVGHTHLPKIFERNACGEVRELPDHDARLESDKRYIVNVGSVGEPRDPEDLRARYVLYDTETREVIFRRVDFDIVSYRNDLEATTLALRPFFLRVYEHLTEGRNVALSSEGSLVDMRVSSDSAALVDLDQVASMAHLHRSDERPRGQGRFRIPIVLVTAAALLLLAFFTFQIFSGTEDSPTPAPVVRAEKTTEKTFSPEAPLPPPVPQPPPPPRESAGAMAVPDRPAVNPGPDQPEAALTRLDPVPVTLTLPPEMFWWRMGDDTESGDLIDQESKITLVTVEEGSTLPPLAPDPVPANQVENRGSRKLGLWREEEPGNHFAMTRQKSFTMEGWFVIRDFRKPVVLLGTRSDREDGRGWHLDLRPRSRGQRGQAMTFFHDSGTSQTVASADGLTVDEAPSHHFAIIWDHDAKTDAGEMRMFLDGNPIAAATLPHAGLIETQVNPFQIGAALNANAANLGLDELRLTHAALEPYQFLMQAPVIGATLIRSDHRSTDSWAIPENWKGGIIPGGSDNVIIGPGLEAQIKEVSPAPFSGQLVLRKGASLQLWTSASERVLPKAQGKTRLIMFAHARLVLHSGENSKLGPIELVEAARLHGGVSTKSHHTTRRFTDTISGPGQLILHGVRGNSFLFESPATYSGGTTTRNQGSEPFHLVGAIDGCFGTGPVEIGDFVSLHIPSNAKDAIANHATLLLSGPKGDLDQKLVLENDETVARFIVDNVDQGEGVFDATTHPNLIGGEGKLTVKNIP